MHFAPVHLQTFSKENSAVQFCLCCFILFCFVLCLFFSSLKRHIINLTPCNYRRSAIVAQRYQPRVRVYKTLCRVSNRQRKKENPLTQCTSCCKHVHSRKLSAISASQPLGDRSPWQSAAYQLRRAILGAPPCA